MSTKTTNLELIKPELTDAADATAYNENWDKLDKTLLTTGGTMEGELGVKGIVTTEPITHDIGSSEIPFGSIHAKHYNIYSHPDKECGEMSVHITGTPDRKGEAVISAGNGIEEGVEGNSRGRVRLFGSDSGYIDIISGNESATNYEILLPNGNGTLALEKNTAKIATGDYDGFGKCGMDYRCQITVPFEAKFVYIFADYPMNGYINMSPFSPDVDYAYVSGGAANNGFKGVPVRTYWHSNRKTVSWCVDSASPDDSENIILQCNVSGLKYYWVAIG